ncbi:DUF3515 family protein [Nocardioides sp. HDW12B]|uniref:DUF3515 family protein n=1 Tax=Nocardioides sp. HDW12B TaxID=2714939 RepID=UPI0014080E69|nr:DUF3515 family protein [Nocardioides sp. HDW12B]QIK67006.1 DUF3515 family protein [Nocardioides sp. HDW12B]
MLPVVLPVVLLAGCTGGEGAAPTGPGPLAVDGPTVADLPAPEADVCRDLLADLPATLEGQQRRDVADPDVLAAAWGDPAIVLRCGGPPPRGLERDSECVLVDDVAWFFRGNDLVDPQGPEVVFSVVKRLVVVEVTRAASYGPPAEVLADLSGPVAATVPARGRCV